MNYEKRFKRFTVELLALIDRHIKEWDEAERDIYDIDTIMERIAGGPEKDTEPVNYSRD